MTSLLVLIILVFGSHLVALDSPQCHEVRLADCGWTDISATTAVASELLKALKYEPKTMLLSLKASLAGLKNNDIDVFLGNWMRAQEEDLKPYFEQNSIMRLNKNLADARYTLAVPAYVYEANVTSFYDLEKHRDKFENKLYGIESGALGNTQLLSMIKDNAFGLGGFELIASSEQSMLIEVKEAIKEKKWIAFLAWAPHPMNQSLDIKYLKDGDRYFGKNFGQAEVYTLTRKNFVYDCQNLGQLFRNLKFKPAMETVLMAKILDEHQSPEQAAQAWLLRNRNQARSWLHGVKDMTGKDGVLAFDDYIERLEQKTSEKKALSVPLGKFIKNSTVSFMSYASGPLHRLSNSLERSLNKMVDSFIALPWLLVITILTLVNYLSHRTLLLSLMIFFGLLFIVNLQLWNEAIETLVLVFLCSSICLLLGAPLGILAAHSPKFYSFLRPVLDLLQTIPNFVYLIPTLMLFGLGLVPGLISTVLFAIEAPIRLTRLGIISVPASPAFKAGKWQRLIKIELPFARSYIREGFSQCVMLSFSMVVIAALVGVNGLGMPVVRSLNTVDIALGFEAGIAIVILAILLNRTLNFRHKKTQGFQ